MEASGSHGNSRNPTPTASDTCPNHMARTDAHWWHLSALSAIIRSLGIDFWSPDWLNSMASSTALIESDYALAREKYRAIGVDTDVALARLATIPISMHCWQGDDVGGFENARQEIGGGLAVTGSYPGKARSPDELRSDLITALSLIPGRHRVSLHASYAETGGRKVERNELTVDHFQGWIEWARQNDLGIDFNPTFFAHPNAASGFTLAHADPAIRRFWIEHGIASRKIAAAIGKSLGSSCVNNVWIPDGFKDLPVDRRGPRERLLQSLDEMFAQPFDSQSMLDAVECKLFGLGSESYVTGSHEFYLGYAITRKKLLCLDAGHFHPTEVISDKISSVLQYVPELLLHVSRGVRWDSDHVVILTDELQAIAQELVRSDFLPRVRIGLDFFDASINRIAAWVIGMRCVQKALMLAFLEPIDKLREFERNQDYTSRLAMSEELRTLPFGAVWDFHCLASGVPAGAAWLQNVRNYEQRVLRLRADGTNEWSGMIS
jgi:L-rhamnose isomerase